MINKSKFTYEFKKKTCEIKKNLEIFTNNNFKGVEKVFLIGLVNFSRYITTHNVNTALIGFITKFPFTI